METIKKLPETTIALIAAGEVITRPVNVVKELLENSLDAGATNIRIIIERGGLNVIEIIDNGCGISLNNAALLCQRYATSKLSRADDLKYISTFGFRGEALASISSVSEIKVSTYNKSTDVQGWDATYKNGLLETDPVPKCLQTQGTHIKVKKLFSNIRDRRKAMKSTCTDEKKHITDLVMRYAMHHCTRVTMSLKEGTNPDLICVLHPMKIESCIGMFFGLEAEANCIRIELDHDHNYTVSVDIMFSYKKLTASHNSSTFVLFCNDRLVECVDLKREIDAVANEFLNLKHHCITTYIALTVPSCDIDVNTHPAKSTVALHWQQEIIALITTELKARLNETPKSQALSQSQAKPKSIGAYPITLLSQPVKTPAKTINLPQQNTLLTSGFLNQSSSTTYKPVQSSPAHTPGAKQFNIRPHDLVHNDSSQQTLEQLSIKSKTVTNCSRKPRSNENNILPWRGIEHMNSASTPKSSSSVGTEINVDFDIESKNIGSPASVPPQRPRRELNFSSLSDLRTQVAKDKTTNNADVIKNSTFVGLFDHDRALIQNGTKLYAINLKSYLKEQYYQFYLFDFGNFPPIDILPPGNEIKHMIQVYLSDIRCHENDVYEKLTYKTTPAILDKLLKHGPMFEDYISLKLTPDEVQTIPCIIPDEIPNLIYLGRFLVELANKVDYSDERQCFKQIGRVIGDFYSEPPANLKDKEVHRYYHDIIDRKLYVAIKNYLIIPEWLLQKENICQISDTKDLYRVFERC